MSDAHARLRLRRTGGLAGVPTEAALDTSELDPDDAQRLLGALDAADLGGAETAPASAAGPPDAFRYELHVDRGGSTHTVAFTDADRPPALEPVIDALAQRARPVRRPR